MRVLGKSVVGKLDTPLQKAEGLISKFFRNSQITMSQDPLTGLPQLGLAFNPQQAEQTRNAIKSHYPNVPVYVHFYSPRWICRVGNYRTYEEAHQMLVSLRDLGFDQATIVKGKITVAY